MTDINASRANDTPRRVTSYENRKVDGMALSCDRVHERSLEKINALRNRQKDYLATLPTDPEAGCKAVRHAMKNWDDYEAPMAVAKANFIILREVLQNGDVENYPDLVESLSLLAEQGMDAVAKIREVMKATDDITSRALGDR